MRTLTVLLLVAVGAPAQMGSYRTVYPNSRQGGQYMHNYYFPPAPSSTPWWPSWSPDGRSIAFAMHGSIWKVDLATSIATQLTYGAKYHSSPEWSPDGKWLIYTADNDARTIQLEIMNVATGETHALTADEYVYLDPAWSPDGTKLAYVCTRPNGYFNIYVRGIRDGKWDGEEMQLTKDNRYVRDRLYFGAWDYHTQPAWTADSKEVLFMSNKDVPLGSGDVYRMPARANGEAEAVKIYSEQTLYRTRPHVSIDGKRFVYSSTAGAADEYTNLYVLPVKGGQPYKLTFGNDDHFHPRFSPDGEWIAYIGNEGGLPWLWLLETYGGERKRVEFKEMRWKQPVGTLRLRIVDEKGVETAARIHMSTGDGKFYAPSTAYCRRGHSGMHTFHSQGAEVFNVPPGRLQIVAVKGFEFVPAQGETTITAGKTSQLTVQVKRLPGWEKDGWYSGSTHVHMNYAGNLRNTPDNLLRMAKAEGMDLVMDQAANKDNRIFDFGYFVKGGGEHPASYGDLTTKLHVGQEYRPPFYGHLFFLGLKDHLISPFTTGYEGTGVDSLYPSNTDMFRKARAQGAAVGYVHAFAGERDPLGLNLLVGKGFGVDLALKTFDCLEWSASGKASLGVIMHAWNNDFRVAPCGGEDSISSLHWTKLVGSVRTYIHSGGLKVEPWLEGIKKGNTFFTTGPLLRFTIDGKIPGEDIKLPASGGSIKINARAYSIAPLKKLVILRNGKEWKTVPEPGLEESIPVTESGWYALYAEGDPYKWLDAVYPQALTNAIRVYVGDGKIRNPESAEYFVKWVAKLKSMADQWLWWRSEKEKQHVFAQFDEATRIYQALK
ncbi:MAG: CehA/McbA family metallohydrolase [Bryobacterales bacterium]|nr:CehA/McbA family metallohydrolase [Bryobacterales bacterium]